MSFRLSIPVAAFLASPLSLAGAAVTPPTAPTAPSSSYSLGVSFANQWRAEGLGPEVAVADLLRGIEDGLAGKKLTPEDRSRASDLLKASYDSFGRRNETAARAFLAQNATAAGVQTTPSGLQYVILTHGEPGAPTAAADDRVTVNYRGTFLDGGEFDSSGAHGKPAVLKPASVIPGWKEALGLMSRGAKWRVFIPPDLAYGPKPPGLIPPNALLIFEIEVLSVERMP